MTDTEFLDYVEVHSQTERHAFSIEDASRLLKLAKAKTLRTDPCGIPGFVAIGESEARRLVNMARGY